MLVLLSKEYRNTLQFKVWGCIHHRERFSHKGECMTYCRMQDWRLEEIVVLRDDSSSLLFFVNMPRGLFGEGF